MHILLLSDLHLDRAYEWAPPNIGDARRAAGRDSLIAIIEHARANQVDIIVCAGDLFDRTTVHPSTIRWLMTALGSVNIPVLITPGDADWLGPQMGYTQHAWPSNVTICNSETLAPLYEVDGLTIWGAAHRRGHQVRSFLDGFSVDRGGTNVAVFHAAERSALEREPELTSPMAFDEKEVTRAGLMHAFVGHCQRPYFGLLHSYPGAPLAHDFISGPTGGFVEIALGDDSVDASFIPVASPPLHDVAIDIGDVDDSQGVLELVEVELGRLRGIVRLRLTGLLRYDVTIRQQDISDRAKLADYVIIDSQETGVSAKGLATTASTVTGQFLEYVDEARLSELQRTRVLALGLGALDQDARIGLAFR